MTREFQTVLESSGIEQTALRNHTPCMVHVIRLPLGEFKSSLRVQGRTKSWEAHERAQQSGENDSTEIGKSQRLWKQGNGRINKVSAMRPGLAKTIEKVRNSRYFESPETDLHIAENTCWIDYADTWSSKRVHSISQSQSPHHSTTHYWCEDKLKLDSGIARVRLPITWIHGGVAEEPKIQLSLATHHHTGWVDHCQVCHESFTAIPVLDPVDVETGYHYTASRHQCLQCHVRWQGWCDASFGPEGNTMKGRLILCREVCSAEPVQISYWSDSNEWYVSHFGTYPWSFPEDAIV